MHIAVLVSVGKSNQDEWLKSDREVEGLRSTNFGLVG